VARLSNSQSRIAVCLALALVTLAEYGPMTVHGFIGIDDDEYIAKNPHVAPGLTWAGLGWALRTGHASNWHPLTWVSHMADCSLYGLNPGGHHLTNLLLHIADTLLLFLLLDGMTGRVWRSAFVAALFAWHPLHVESVAWASERKDVLSTLFWILTLMAYVRYVEGSRTGTPRARVFYGLALICFALGLMSKPMVVTLPCVLLLIDFWPLERNQEQPAPPATDPDQAPETGKGARRGSWRWLVLEKAPFFAMAFAASVVTYLVQRTGGAVSSLQVLPLHVRLGNAVLTYVRYLGKAVWPVDLAAIYPYAKHLPWGTVALSALFLAAVTGWILLRSKQNPYLVTGWFWYLGTLVPTIGLVQVGSQSMADRYMYIPSIGLFILVVWGLSDLLSFWRPRQVVLAAAGTAALAGCLVCTRLQLGYWSDSEKLFQHAVEVTRDNYLALNGLGATWNEAGRNDEAMALYSQAVAIEPRYAEGQYNLGTALLERGKLEEAAGHLNAALTDNPDYAQAHNNLGKTLQAQGNLDEAAAHIAKAVILKPDYAEAHYNLGTIRLLQSKLDEAIALFSEALRLKPDYPEAHGNLGIALMRRGDFTAGAAHFSEQVRLNPRSADGHVNLGLAMMQLKKPDVAAAQFFQALQLAPNNPKVRYHLALALTQQHKSREAAAQYHEALRLSPDFADALNNLAWILASSQDAALRDGPEAVRLAQKACELTKSRQPGMMDTLAAAYAEAGRYTEAVATAETAVKLASAAGQKASADRSVDLLKQFQSGQPFREPF
jgi:protein O-mannosyl-transferase